MIIVTGATGKLGSRIVRQLLERVSPEQLGVSVRDVGKASELADRGVRVRHGDYTDPVSLATAFEGADQVLVISAGVTGGDAVAQHAAVIDAARDAGAGRVVYTSHQGASFDSVFEPMPDHAGTERYLSDSGRPFTSLRNGFYSSTVLQLIGGAVESGQLVAPADGPVSWTTHDDLAQAAATILIEEGRFDGITPPLTAPTAHDLADVAGILSELTGRTIRRVVADDDEWVRSMIARGIPERGAAMLLGMFRASRRGEFATTDPTLEAVLGRSAQGIRSVLQGAVSG